VLKRSCFFFICIPFFLQAEPFVAKLEHAYSNTEFLFQNKTQRFTCKPYGVITLEDLYFSPLAKKGCKSAIREFYKKHPDLEYLFLDVLKTQQRYHIVFRKNRCIIYAQGENTYSELLLHRGLAQIKPFFQDTEFLYSFKNAQKNAQLQKRGLWEGTLSVECKSALYRP